MKVLIVDDSPEALAVAKVRLAKERVDIVCAGSGRDGLHAAKEENPDLVLLDLDMPDMTGFEVCRQLKSAPETCMIPIIFLTASESCEDKIKGLDFGAVDYVTKPFDAYELRARVRAALRTKHLQDLLVEYAQVDPLTGLANRRALMERMQQEWARIRRHDGSLAFVMIDIDHFKRVNDNYGHQVGDRVLCEVARAIARECRESDVPARYGGEEFGILVPDGNLESGAMLAERCRQSIVNIRVQSDDDDVRVTASFGVGDSSEANLSEEVIEQADEALYRAKHAGRNCVETSARGAIDHSVDAA